MKKIMILALLLAASALCAAEPEGPRGSVKGRIVDTSTKRPVAGLSVSVLDTPWRAIADENGGYELPDLPTGEYRLLFEGGGNEPLVKSEVVVRPARITYVNVEVHRLVVTEAVTVSSPYFSRAESQQPSQARFGTEELRRAPGSANDISRALYALPGVTQSEDISNDLVVRGGSPFENAFLIDNIPAVNINHFPQLGASGGNMTMLNIDFVESVSASTGGFGAEYGNALSSVIDVRFRDGNHERSEGQLDLNMTGFGGTYEGPLGRNASWQLAAKRSFLDLVADHVGVDTRATWTDLNAKLDWNLNERHRVSVLSIDGDSRSDRSREKARETGSAHGWERFQQYVNGVNWRALWGGRTLSETSFSYNGQRMGEMWGAPSGPEVFEDHRISDDVFSLRNVNQTSLGASYELKAGVEGSYRRASYDDRPSLTVRRLSGFSVAGFLSQTWRPWRRLSTTLGLRAERFAFPDKLYLSPRLGVSWLVGRRLTANASYGWYRQQLPLYLIGQAEANEALAAPRVSHAIVGVRVEPFARAQVSIEAYRKDYGRFPLSTRAPYWFVIDDVHGDSDSFGSYGELRDEGRAEASGVDLLFQLKPTPRLYGTVSASLSRSRYRGLDGTWRNRYFDNRYVFSVVAGYKAGRTWELGSRWIIVGGKAFTPIDVAQSRAAGYTVRDAGAVMSSHYPAYHSLSLRVDRRFYFRRTNLATYVSVWNVYNHDNVLADYWDARRGSIATEKQWSILPVLGIEFEF